TRGGSAAGAALILGRAKSHAAAASHVVGDGAGNRLFFEAGQGQAQIGRARSRHVDRQDAMLEGEGEGVLQTRRKRRGDFTEASLLSSIVRRGSPQAGRRCRR